jgi:hypothetical protein
VPNVATPVADGFSDAPKNAVRSAGVSTIWLQYWMPSCASAVCCCGAEVAELLGRRQRLLDERVGRATRAFVGRDTGDLRQRFVQLIEVRRPDIGFRGPVSAVVGNRRCRGGGRS